MREKTARVFKLGATLDEISEKDFLIERPQAVIITEPNHAKKWMDILEVRYDGDINLNAIEFCKVEVQTECIVGTLCIPAPDNIIGDELHMQFFITEDYILAIDDRRLMSDIIRRIKQKRTNQADTRERFIYNFLAQILERGLQILGRYERMIMKIEEDVLAGEIDDFQESNKTIRRELLILREYYDELRDVGKELEENENDFFDDDRLTGFGIISDRADRLMNRTKHLLDYINTVHDAYKEQVADEQNKNMEFLTIISTIFFPLTLITGWYGMNFQNMPELEKGYPMVIMLSLVVIAIIIWIFKKKKIL